MSPNAKHTRRSAAKARSSSSNDKDRSDAVPAANPKLTRMKADTFRATLRLDLGFRGPVHVPEAMKIRDTGIERLCEALCVDGDLDLRGCVNLRELPARLVVRGKLYIDGCVHITALPDSARELFGFSASGCSALTSISPLVECRGQLDLTGCPSISSLSPEFRAEEKVTLTDCVLRPDVVELKMLLADSLVAALPGKSLRQIVIPPALALHPVLDAKVLSTKVLSDRLELGVDAGDLFRK